MIRTKNLQTALKETAVELSYDQGRQLHRAATALEILENERDKLHAEVERLKRELADRHELAAELSFIRGLFALGRSQFGRHDSQEGHR